MKSKDTPELLARERVLQLLSVEMTIAEDPVDDDEARYAAALSDAFDTMCREWEMRLTEGGRS